MTRIDFYLLADTDDSAAARFACRLAARALDNGMPVLVHTQDQPAADSFDELLWSYPDYRFVPHGLAGSNAARSAPVVIGCGEPAHSDGLLVNLGEGVPSFFGRFERVAEVITAARREDGRQRYKHYRDRGYPLFHHELDDWENS